MTFFLNKREEILLDIVIDLEKILMTIFKTCNKKEKILKYFIIYFPELDVKSFCKILGPLSYSKIKHLRLDGNRNITHTSLPPNMYECLRVANEITVN